jgi:hypothetical protein
MEISVPADDPWFDTKMSVSAGTILEITVPDGKAGRIGTSQAIQRSEQHLFRHWRYPGCASGLMTMEGAPSSSV